MKVILKYLTIIILSAIGAAHASDENVKDYKSIRTAKDDIFVRDTSKIYFLVPGVAIDFGLNKIPYENWSCLYVEKRKTILRKSKITFIRYQPPQETSSEEILVGDRNQPQPLFCVANLNSNGGVETKHLKSNIYGDYNTFDFMLHYTKGEFKIIKKREPTEQSGSKKESLVLEHENSSEILDTNFYEGRLYWVGDINNDGLPDLISHKTTEACSEYQFYLSDSKDKFKIGKVAEAFNCGY